MTNDSLQGYFKVLWRYKDSYVLPNVLDTEKIVIKIYENHRKVTTKHFYANADI